MMLVQHLVQPPEPPRSHSSVPTPTPTSTTIPSAPSPAPLELGRSQWEASKPSTSTPYDTPIFTLRPATLDDAAQIAQLGGDTFATSFGFSIPSADLKVYLAEAYTVEAISTDICSPDKHFLVATSTSSNAPSDDLIGFTQLTESTTDACLSHLPQSQICELQRLYVHPSAQGLGVGKSLMSSIERLARGKGYKAMWLGVWEGNFIAQRVYESMGFERVGEHEFRMGRCIQPDWIMVKEL